jgi:hypothetical protein
MRSSEQLALTDGKTSCAFFPTIQRKAADLVGKGDLKRVKGVIREFSECSHVE